MIILSLNIKFLMIMILMTNIDNFNTISEYLLEKYDINTNSIHDEKNIIKNKIVLNEREKLILYCKRYLIDPEFIKTNRYVNL